MANILVTGGCGFIGSNLIHYLLHAEPGWTIINFDSLTYAANPRNLEDVKNHPRYHFIQGDVTDRRQVRAAMMLDIQRVIHLAAESHVDRSIQDSSPFMHTNVLGTQILLDAARECSVKRFLQVSTDEVYGSLGPTGYFTEESPLKPSSPYAASKAAADLLVQCYHHTFGVPTVITRCSNNYGAYQFPEKLMPLAITNLLANKPVPIHGDGLQVRDWIHVLDHCRAIRRVIRHGEVGQVYNVGARCEVSNIDLVEMIRGLLGRPAWLIRHVADRLGQDRRYAIDPSKIENELGWRPVMHFMTGLRNTVDHYRIQAGQLSQLPGPTASELSPPQRAGVP